MNKLHSLAFYALVTPVITLSSGALLAQQSTDPDVDRAQQSTPRDQDATQTTPKASQGDKHKKQRDGQYGSRTDSDHRSMGGKSDMQNRGYLSAAPANGMQASELIGAEVTTSANENVGAVTDLIIDENGQVVAVAVSVGGFLGLGERDVAIGWDDITKSGTSDNLELRIDVTTESLRSAPEFETQD